ncbi:hypothetical protein HHL25_10500 [Rhizobium sp. S-51]|uniref:Polymerase nucleotidyl transferase domain-containing protein n=1 Tax=Rhizobium terricola TaxID=2728849 RepID=A0A7Y0AW89_9HYPH|nr:nucleotidyltransferase domain-containing protein [Rhizobium terricola]NML74552.1 hypothetical protein [Rhizobium terricola]
MDKNAVIAKLREHRDELSAVGVEHISIFGSVARGDNTPDSDLDVLVTFSNPVLNSGFGYFSAIEDVRERVKAITGLSAVDVLPEPVQRETTRRNIERDRAVAF